MRGAYLEPEAFTGTANGWKAGEIRIEKKKKKYCFFHVSGEYEEAEGSFTYTLDKEGMLEIGYDFVLKQDVSPRQVGLVFDLPGSFGTLYWDRKGFWTVYPPTHIGREAGVATTHMDIPASLLPGPTDPAQTDWENERNSLGSNDFRATRTRIRLAGLEDNNGNSVEIHSDGSQSVRAWHEDGRVRILVADYVNGGAERFNKASRELEHVTWEKGKRITGTVRIKPNLQGI